MYVVTFYSFKGGVGRTSALMNTATLLAASGKRVLLVDFDLEAPGLCSYRGLQGVRGKPGIVEYISEFVRDNIAPRVESFISECELNSHPIWILPAGNINDPSYSERLGSINWETLYAERSGYLLFEDLKQQWETYKEIGFDYVFIDSRTGHTDIGGICTRQLPHAVVVMFLPTEQNIDGLVPVVEAVRREAISARRRKIELHFCPSNVPNLDDENDILEGMFEKAKSRLGYDEVASCIHHYNSLDLLSEAIFSVARKGTSLAKEYAKLRDAVVASNYDDRDGAVIAMKRALEAATRSEAFGKLNNLPLDSIQETHADDAEVASWLARAYGIIGDNEQSLASLNVAIEGGYEIIRNLALRGSCHLSLGNRDAALSDWLSVLEFKDAPADLIVRAVNMVRDLDQSGWAAAVEKSTASLSLTGGDRRRLVQVLMSAPESLPLAVRLSEKAMAEEVLSAEDREHYKYKIVLASIALHKFRYAMHALAINRNAVLENETVADVFNYAIAEWGLTRKIPCDLFARVVELGQAMLEKSKGERSFAANFLQCLALAHFVCGDRQRALELVKSSNRQIKRTGRAFSCWSFLELPQGQFLEDNTQMEEMMKVDTEGFAPRFFNHSQNTRLN
ncbi:MAG: ParA family protein [Hyphomonadaceae bacterium]|nr:ParA family protein [Hyphomonadaceae bacterium]